MKYCYQCDELCAWLAPDSRCRLCTRVTPEELAGAECGYEREVEADES